jgi:hypothetical protein
MRQFCASGTWFCSPFISRRRRLAIAAASSGFALAAMSSALRAAITINKNSSTNWTIGNGELSVIFDPATNNITSLSVAANGGSSGNLLDPGDSQLYPEFAGTPFGAGTQTSGDVQGSNYIDFWTTTASTGTSTNPVTY